jgi:hypothetical protein
MSGLYERRLNRRGDVERRLFATNYRRPISYGLRDVKFGARESCELAARAPAGRRLSESGVVVAKRPLSP